MKPIFNFEASNTNLKTEITAGVTTFLAMAYILGALFLLKFVFIG